MADTIIRSLAAGVPANSLVGNLGAGVGPAQPVSIEQVAQAVIALGVVMTPGTSVPFSPIADNRFLANISGGVAVPVAHPFTDIVTVGTIATGTWNGSVVTGQYGGTGVANTGKTITLGGNVSTGGAFTVSGAFGTTVTVTATTNSTLPAGTHTLAGLDVAQTWTANQQFNSGNFILKGSSSGTLTVQPAAAAGSNTLTLPAGTTDFSATGPGVIQQASSGAAFTVGTVNLASTNFVTGTLPVANGGTGLTSGTSGGILGYTASGTLASSAALTAKALVVGGGAGATPTTIAALTDGQLAIGSTGNNPVPGTITAGSGISVTNASGAITVALSGGSGGSAGMTLVQTLTASSSAQLDFTGLTGKKYVLIGRILQPATNGANVHLLLGTGAGPTFGTANYSYSFWYLNNVGTSGNSNSNSAAQFLLTTAIPNTGGATTMGSSFKFDIDTDNTTFATILGQMQSSHTDTTTYTWTGGGRWTIGANQLTGIRVQFSTGNIASGTLSLYALTE